MAYNLPLGGNMWSRSSESNGSALPGRDGEMIARLRAVGTDAIGYTHLHFLEHLPRSSRVRLQTFVDVNLIDPLPALVGLTLRNLVPPHAAESGSIPLKLSSLLVEACVEEAGVQSELWVRASEIPALFRTLEVCVEVCHQDNFLRGILLKALFD